MAFLLFSQPPLVISPSYQCMRGVHKRQRVSVLKDDAVPAGETEISKNTIVLEMG
jgi:hypothetical protein